MRAKGMRPADQRLVGWPAAMKIGSEVEVDMGPILILNLYSLKIFLIAILHTASLPI